MTIWRSAALAVFILVPTGLAATGPSPTLFRETAVSERGPSRANPGVIRAREVLASPHDLAVRDVPVGFRIERRRDVTLNLFDDAWFPVRLEAVERDRIGSTIWYGRVTGEPRSSVTLTVKESSMSVSLSAASRRYVVRPMRNGIHEAVELDSARFPRELEPLPALVGDAVAGDVIAADDGSTWDILVAYTHIVRNFYGSAAAVEALISNAIAATNTAYLNSGVNSRVRLVGAIETNYDDQTASFSTTLNRLRQPEDSFMDAVVTQRDTVGADAVALLVYNPTDNACGIGYLMTTPGAGFAPNAFSVTRDDCAVGNFSFAHELGHNFGLAHDRANAGGGASYSYAFGYQDTTNLFRDIMAYDCPVSCPRIQYFSNPEVMYNGRPLGVIYTDPLAADNRRALNASATFIGNWRQTVVTLISFTDDPLVAGTTVVKAVHVTELRTAINARRVAAGLSAATWTNPIAVGGTIGAADLEEMRSALTPALGSLPTYTDAALSGVTVKAIHIQELRDLTR